MTIPASNTPVSGTQNFSPHKEPGKNRSCPCRHVDRAGIVTSAHCGYMKPLSRHVARSSPGAHQPKPGSNTDAVTLSPKKPLQEKEKTYVIDRTIYLTMREEIIGKIILSRKTRGIGLT